MKPTLIQQEVLLNTNTRFAHRQWTEKEPGQSEGLNGIESLEKACWDGLVKELIPELDITLDAGTQLWLWQIHATHSFLALDFYEYPAPKEKESSIDPDLIMDSIYYN